jgi:hypothetical protein
MRIEPKALCMLSRLSLSEAPSSSYPRHVTAGFISADLRVPVLGQSLTFPTISASLFNQEKLQPRPNSKAGGSTGFALCIPA